MPAPHWRAHLAAHGIAVHPAADRLPMLADEELRELARDIEAHGLRVPVELWTDASGKRWLLSGRNRIAAMSLLVEPDEQIAGAISTAIVRDHTLTDPAAFVRSVDVIRRHLTREQRRELITAELRENPARSDRAIAAAVGVHHETVAAARAQAEGRGGIRHVTMRTDSVGRQQPATKAAPAPRRPAQRDAVLVRPPPRPETKEEQLRRMREARAEAEPAPAPEQRIEGAFGQMQAWLAAHAELVEHTPLDALARCVLGLMVALRLTLETLEEVAVGDDGNG